MLRAAAGRCWSDPLIGCFKLNVVAALNLDEGRYGVRIIFMDDQEVVVEAVAPSFNGVVSVDVAEVKAVLEGLLLVEDVGLFPLIVESDAIGMIISIRRACNSVDHSVARYFVNNNCSVVWFADFLAWLSLLANSDLHNCSRFLG
ncbi:hypothetical protein Dsin_032204 [Dipteronia sinensis]|uniref:RNase H type-1 domain-containing protein n=1 Tax=Dipteronia sinensis TaxID=43782 RepID=A0AAD9ZNC8_9ROSI|nr:hypothetical protein Dsin_032204 [Dipteronia sinensis]